MDKGGVQITNHSSSGDWKVIMAGGGMVALGIGAALLAAQLGTAAIILAVGGSIGLAAAGIGKGFEYYQRGKGQAHLGQALVMAARRGDLPETAESARRLQDGQEHKLWTD